MMKSKQYDKAVALLQEPAETPGNDQLAFALDYATALQLNGQFKESADIFIYADKLSEVKDYTSLSRETGAMLTGERAVQYKGESYELVLLNAMNAINFLRMNQLDSALVEAKRVNEKLYRYKYEGNRPYSQNTFAYYLAGLIWEADRKYDDAYLDYKRVYELAPSTSGIGIDLLRTAYLSGRSEDFQKWKREFPGVSSAEYDRNTLRQKGEIVVIYQQGWGPKKAQVPGNHRIPKLIPRLSRTQKAALEVNGELVAQSRELFNVEAVAIQTLKSDYGRLIARRMGGIAAKAVVSDQIRQQNEGLGQLAWVVMNVMDQADLRQWASLPERFHIIRYSVKPGRYTVRINGLDQNGYPTSEISSSMEVVVPKGRKVFLNWRSTN